MTIKIFDTEAEIIKSFAPMNGDIIVKQEYSGHDESGDVLLTYFYYIVRKHYVKFKNSNKLYLIAEYNDTDEYGFVEYLPLSSDFPLKKETFLNYFYVNYENYLKLCELTSTTPDSFKTLISTTAENSNLGTCLWPENFK